MKNISSIVFTILFLFPIISFGQGSLVKQADKLYEEQSYYYACEAYEDALVRKADSLEIAAKIADSYDKLKNINKAVAWYRFILNYGDIEKRQLIRLAILERTLENYEEFERLIGEYVTKFGKEGLADDMINHPPIETLEKNKGWFTVKKQDFNTEHSEMGVSYLNDNEIIYSSSARKSLIVGLNDGWTGEFFYDVYRAPIDYQGQIGKGTILKSGVNTKYHDGPACFNAKLGYLYFTRNNFIDGIKGEDDSSISRLKLYRAKLVNDKFEEVEELSINSDNFSNAHPNVSINGDKLYFASDRPGGFGGMDIYYIGLDSKGLPTGEPVNLGEVINTPENEVFPFYNTEERLLFFSSDGHFGLGGLDIYVSRLDQDGNPRNIENLGIPINSSFDDFAFIHNEKQTKGYFASNRRDAVGSDDIYGFAQNVRIKNTKISKGTIADLANNTPMEGVEITITDKKGKVISQSTSDKDGKYEMDIQQINTDFKLKATKEGYVKVEQDVKYDNAKSDYNVNLDLVPVLDYYFSGIIRDKETGAPMEGVRLTITDHIKNEVFATFTTDGSGSFTTELIPYAYGDAMHYDFKLEKFGYITKTITIDEINKELKANIDVDKKYSMHMVVPEEGVTDLNVVSEIKPIHYDLNSANLRPSAKKELDIVVKLMQDNPGMEIELKSHTDSRGSSSLNQKLSNKRAESARKYLISKGINKNRITAKGYGKSKLLYSDTDIAKAKTNEEKEKLHEKNRRTEFIVVKMN